MFRSTLDSCRSKSISDDVASSEQPFFFPKNPHHHHHLIELFSPKPPPSRSFPSLCRPKSHENQNISFDDFNPKPKHKKQRSRSRKTRKQNNRKLDEFFCSVAANYYGLYSSEDEKEGIMHDYETTFFSSKSMSSDSLESFTAAYNNVGASGKSRKKEQFDGFDDEEENELMKMRSPLDGKVKDSVAVIKCSSDPYNDFRTSMVEMIVEKQIFGSKDLEKLLQCFLSLNSVSHHRVIIEVFTEILETLFSDLS